MKFSVLFWNVENFGRFLGADPAKHAERVEKIKDHIRGLAPDLFCLCEIKDKVALRNLIIKEFSDYDFGVTDGLEQIELLGAWKRDKFQQVLFTQRREFKVGEDYLRPGTLISAKFDGRYYNFLFLHTDSGRTNRDYSNRQDMFEKIWSLKERLDEITGGPNDSLFVTMGDLNTMGRSQSGSYSRISADDEIDDLLRDAGNNGMHLLSKNHPTTWRKGPSAPTMESNLDHGLSTDNISFKKFKNPTTNKEGELRVDGWNHLVGEDREEFTEFISDHCSIYCEID